MARKKKEIEQSSNIKINIEQNQEDKKENEYIKENNKNMSEDNLQNIIQKKKNIVALDDIIHKNEILEPVDYLDELPELKDLKVFNKSIMQNCFLFRLKREEPKRHILIQTNNNETFLGQLISFDEYTLHVYVNDGKFNSAMLFFKSGLTYIRVLSDAAYEYYLKQQENKKNQQKLYKNNIKSNFMQKDNTKISENMRKSVSNEEVHKLVNKFNINSNKKRKEF